MYEFEATTLVFFYQFNEPFIDIKHDYCIDFSGEFKLDETSFDHELHFVFCQKYLSNIVEKKNI